MRVRVVVFGLLGTLVTLLAAAAVFLPRFVQGVGPLAGFAETLAGIDRRQLLLLASGAVGLFVSVATWRATRSARGDRDAFDEATAGPPESVTTASQRLTAAGLDREFDEAIRGNDESSGRIRDRLRETATRTYARANGCETDAARDAVRNGEWTDDRVAAATLADEDGPTYSIASRLRLWLDRETERERRFHRTVQAIRDLDGGNP